jgi:hypothetical protein
MFKHALGSKVRDRVTGYTGIVIGQTSWLYGCRRYTVQSQEMKDGKPVDPLSFDEDALEIVEESKVSNPVKDTGGPQREALRARDVTR